MKNMNIKDIDPRSVRFIGPYRYFFPNAETAIRLKKEYKSKEDIPKEPDPTSATSEDGEQAQPYQPLDPKFTERVEYKPEEQDDMSAESSSAPPSYSQKILICQSQTPPPPPPFHRLPHLHLRRHHPSTSTSDATIQASTSTIDATASHLHLRRHHPAPTDWTCSFTATADWTCSFTPTSSKSPKSILKSFKKSSNQDAFRGGRTKKI